MWKYRRETVFQGLLFFPPKSPKWRVQMCSTFIGLLPDNKLIQSVKKAICISSDPVIPL